MGGDGIGPEIVSATVKCISAMGLPIEFHEPMHGRAAVEAGGNALPDSVKETIQNSSAVLFGAIDTVSGHSGPILRYLRFHCDAYANLRPACSIEPLRGVIGKEGCNLVIVRELSEGGISRPRGRSGRVGTQAQRLYRSHRSAAARERKVLR